MKMFTIRQIEEVAYTYILEAENEEEALDLVNAGEVHALEGNECLSIEMPIVVSID